MGSKNQDCSYGTKILENSSVNWKFEASNGDQSILNCSEGTQRYWLTLEFIKYAC